MANNLAINDLVGAEDESVPHAAATIITRFNIITDKVDAAIDVSCMDPTVLRAGPCLEEGTLTWFAVHSLVEQRLSPHLSNDL